MLDEDTVPDAMYSSLEADILNKIAPRTKPRDWARADWAGPPKWQARRIVTFVYQITRYHSDPPKVL